MKFIFINLALVLAIGNFAYANDLIFVRTSKAKPCKLTANKEFSSKAGTINRISGGHISAATVDINAGVQIKIDGYHDLHYAFTHEHDTVPFKTGKEFQSDTITAHEGAISLTADEVLLRAPVLSAKETIVTARKLRIALGLSYQEGSDEFLVETHQMTLDGKLKFIGNELELEVTDEAVPHYFDNLDYAPEKTTVRAIFVFPEKTTEGNWELVEKDSKIIVGVGKPIPDKGPQE